MTNTTTEFGRDGWEDLRLQLAGDDEDPLPVSAYVGGQHVRLDFGDGVSQVDVSAVAASTTVCIGDVSVHVQRNRVVVVVAHPPYPIARWSVLLDASLT